MLQSYRGTVDRNNFFFLNVFTMVEETLLRIIMLEMCIKISCSICVIKIFLLHRFCLGTRYHTTKYGESPSGTRQNMATKKIVLCLRLCHSSERAIYLMVSMSY